MAMRAWFNSWPVPSSSDVTRQISEKYPFGQRKRLCKERRTIDQVFPASARIQFAVKGELSHEFASKRDIGGRATKRG